MHNNENLIFDELMKIELKKKSLDERGHVLAKTWGNYLKDISAGWQHFFFFYITAVHPTTDQRDLPTDRIDFEGGKKVGDHNPPRTMSRATRHCDSTTLTALANPSGRFDALVDMGNPMKGINLFPYLRRRVEGRALAGLGPATVLELSRTACEAARPRRWPCEVFYVLYSFICYV